MISRNRQSAWTFIRVAAEVVQTATLTEVHSTNFRAEMTSQTQPTTKQTPPKGVMKPSHFQWVMAIEYNEPENKMIPANNASHGPEQNSRRCGKTNKITVWMK